MKNIFSLFFLHESCSENILGIGLSFVPMAGNNIWIVSVKEKKTSNTNLFICIANIFHMLKGFEIEGIDFLAAVLTLRQLNRDICLN